MIKKITIKNFQSHKNTVLRLCEGINGIIGKSNSGKTAILRAIELVRTNRPSGFAFHSTFSKAPYTKILIDTEKEKIQFKKIGTKTEYKGKSGYKSGRNVPDEITNSLNLEDINFSSQMGLPFLVTSSAPEFARTINQAIKTEDIDKCISLTNEKLRGYERRLSTLNQEVKDAELKLRKLKPINKVGILIESADSITDKIKETKEQIYDIEYLSEEIKNAERLISKGKMLDKAVELIDEAEDIDKKIQKTIRSIGLIEQSINLEEVIDHANEEKNNLIKEYVSELKEQKKCPICYSVIDSSQINQIKRELS